MRLTRIRHVLAIVVLYISSACTQNQAPAPEEPCGFIQNTYQQRVSWKAALPIRIALDESVPEEAIPSVYQSIAAWEMALGRKLFEVIGRVKSAGPARDGVNVIYFLDSWSEFQDGEQARTVISWRGDWVNEADIAINSGKFAFRYGDEVHSEEGKKVLDSESLLTHEFGHVLGLGHNDIESSVMNSKLDSFPSRDALRRQIQPSDEKALSCEYERG